MDSSFACHAGSSHQFKAPFRSMFAPFRVGHSQELHPDTCLTLNPPSKLPPRAPESPSPQLRIPCDIVSPRICSNPAPTFAVRYPAHALRAAFGWLSRAALGARLNRPGITRPRRRLHHDDLLPSGAPHAPLALRAI